LSRPEWVKVGAWPLSWLVLARVKQHSLALTMQDGWCVDVKHFFLGLYWCPIPIHCG
jgi:hypothetical protein